MLDDVRERAKELLASGRAKVVVGYRAGRRETLPVPFFARSAADAERLVLNPHCRGGLAAYAKRETANGPAAFVACRHEIRALKVLAQEGQVPAENVLVIGYMCDIPGNAVGKMALLDGERLDDFAFEAADERDATAEEVARLKALSSQQRWSYWRAQFDRCVRCYACRSACPMCYCEECVAERNLPQWVEATAGPRGNMSWNLIRAWHLAGRCVGCGACARACPEGIRLDVLNRLLADEITAVFGHSAGEGSMEEAAFFATFKEDDDEAFILEE